MARVWFLIIVSIQIVLAGRNSEDSCDVCIQNGYTWCKAPETLHCWPSKTDACAQAFEKLPTVRTRKPGNKLHVSYAEQDVQPSTRYDLSIGYNSTTESEIKINIQNSTYAQYIEFSTSTKCENSECTATISVQPSNMFCTALRHPSPYEHIYVNFFFVSLDETTLVKFLIPCACPCSSKAEVRSDTCHKNGDLVCGVCQCYRGWSGTYCNKSAVITPETQETEHVSLKCNNNGAWLPSGSCLCMEGWTGKYCNKPICEQSRDDIGCSGYRSEKGVCSGNGHCDACDNQCICKTDIEGSQYLEPDNRCMDLCMIVEQCEDCLTSNGPLQCSDCDITKDPYNKTISEQRDSLNRTVWVHCSVIVADECQIIYLAMKENNVVHIMIEDPCKATAPAGLFTSPVTSILFGLLVLACIASLVAVVVWKYFNRLPAQEMMKPGYTSVEAATSMIQNPAYITPISSYSNPMYNQKC